MKMILHFCACVCVFVFVSMACERVRLCACAWKFKRVFFEPVLEIDILITSREIGLRWVPQIPINDMSILVPVMV